MEPGDIHAKTYLPPSSIQVPVYEKTQQPLNSLLYREQLGPMYYQPLQASPAQVQQQHQSVPMSVGGIKLVDQPRTIILDSQPQMPTSHQQQTLECRHCRKIVISKVQYKCGRGTLTTGVVLSVVTLGFFGWVPCVMKRCKDAIHVCPSCNKNMGVYRFLF